MSNIIEKTNEAFQTAKLTSYWLYLAGLDEAVEYAKLINLNQMDGGQIPHYDVMKRINPIIHEIRYKSINEYIRKSGCKNIVDIACGYSPRGILFAREGFNYIGLDLPVVASELAPVVESLNLEKLRYCGGDATNYQSLMDAVSDVDGPVCVVVEGITMYLNTKDVETLYNNVARILRSRPGSVFITTDPGFGYVFSGVINAMMPTERFMPTVGMLFEMYNWASDGGITHQTERRSLESEVQRFLDCGLKAVPSPTLPSSVEMKSIDSVDEEVREKILQSLQMPNVFISSAVEDYEDDDDISSVFGITAAKAHDKIKIEITGRLDTITVPKLLELITDCEDGITEVEIDLSKVEYISAAGYRSFHLIRKDFPHKKLTLTGASEEIQKVIDNDEIIKKL